MHLSVIIPTLNEEYYIRGTLDALRTGLSKGTECEVIVVDSGSNDKTLVYMKNRNIILTQKPEFKGFKYKSLNYGASLANGSVLLFLDADSFLKYGFDKEIRKVLQGNVVGGAFEYCSENRSISLRVIEVLNRIRYRVDQNYFGDQGIFCTKEAFETVGGYPEKPIMEAAYFCKKLRSIGKLKLIKLPLITSSRRFEKGGVWRVFFKDTVIWIQFLLGCDISRYAAKYWKENLFANKK